MAPREYPLTETYAKFVNAGLIEHIGRNGRQADLPDGIKNATQDLTSKQKAIIEEEIGHQIAGILEGLSAVQAIPGYQGTSEDAKKFLQEILELAEKANIDNAHAALEKVNSFNPTALETEDMEVEDAPQPKVSESLAPLDAAAAQTAPGVDSGAFSPGEATPGASSPGEAMPVASSPGEAMPGASSPGEAMPGASSPGEATPGAPSPGEATPGAPPPGEAMPGAPSPGEAMPGASSPEQQARSGVRHYGKGRRLPAGERAEAFEKENIPWTTGDPHDWPWLTYPLENGGAIMAEKETERQDGWSNKISYYLVEIPVEKEKDGEVVTLYQHKLVRYSDYASEIDEWKRLADETGEERCVFKATDPTGKRDGKNYKFLRLEFVAPLTRLTKKKESTSLTSEAECIIYAEGQDKPVFLVTSQFKRAQGVGDRKGKLLISRVCGRDGQAIPSRTEPRRISELNRACPDNAEDFELLDSTKTSTALPSDQQGLDENAFFGRVQAYVDRRFADFSKDLGEAVASSIADEMAKLTINIGSMIEAQIQAQMYEVRDGNREIPSSTNANLRYNAATRETTRGTPQSAAATPRNRERTLPPGFLPSPPRASPRASPLHRSIEA